MYVKLRKRADGMPDANVACESVVIEVNDEQTTYMVHIDFDPDSGENGEHRIVVDEECVWSVVH